THNSPLQDLGANAKTFLIAALQKLDVVTREEYEVQVAVLARTREKLDALEKQVQALERERSN
ncbi:MAG: accessory factor UbiK family protein, partial [Hydromonas sp.]|nr:accessory factor UbiK family protein [Hydromonas sp.]